MHAHTPPYTKPEAVHDSAHLYRETSEIASAQDAALDGKPDPVNAPSHYELGDRQAIDVIESVAATVIDPVDAVLTSHALKYLMRWPRKGGITDLLKCRWYLSRLIARVEDRAERKATLTELAREGQTLGLYDPPFEGNPDDCAFNRPLAGSRIATPAELADLRRQACGIGDVERRHPMAAEADRIAAQADGCRDFREDAAGYFHFKPSAQPGDHL